MKSVIAGLALLPLLLPFAVLPGEVKAQESIFEPSEMPAERRDLTRPDEQQNRIEAVEIFEARRADTLTPFNFFAFWVQRAVELGIPANTIVLILLVPILAALVTFVRIMIGLPSLEMLVPIALAFAFVAVGVVVGLIILAAVVAASFSSRILLRHLPIMYFPKRSLSLLLLSFFVLGALIASIMLDLQTIRGLSIFPIIILMLLGDSIVSVQLHKNLAETIQITGVTIVLGLSGFALATTPYVHNLLILYPEVVLLAIPINILMGRYFGLRASEFFRFRSMTYGSE